MLCFNCAYNSGVEDIKECPLCGMKFPQKCNTCEALNPLMARFCFHCGIQLAKQESQNLINNGVLSENRKNVAVIFADISGFTALSEFMDPEEIREIINDCFNCITRPVYEFEGTIDKYIGDCVMILFGAKHIHYDDPKRAVLCAMKMQKLIHIYTKEKLSNKGVKLDISIGINYGLVVTGKVGNYFDKDYTVLGDVVNTAQRLQSNADKGSIFVSESVYLETKDVIDYSNEMEIMVKNKKDSVKCYIPIDIKGTLDSNLSTLIGREEQCTFLNKLYQDKMNNKVITLLGEAGIGKTSTLINFLRSINENVKKLWVDCNISYQKRVYYTLASIIFHIIDANDSDSNLIKQSRLKSVVEYILNEYSKDEMKRNYDFLGLIIGLDRDHDFQSILNAMKYEDIKEEIINQLSMFFESYNKKHELLIIVDGLHWADTGSLHIMKELITRNLRLRKMFIFTSRYELDIVSIFDESVNDILKLERLDNETSRKLACYLLDCNDIDSTLFDLIIRLTDGNPLYIIELLRAIKRKGQYYIKDEIIHLDIAQVNSLPDSIEKLILENLSEFDEMTLKFLETASVMGKDFTLSWMESLLEDCVDVTRIINLLMERNVLSLSTVQLTSGTVDKVYRFNEDLTREVLYRSILNKRKIEIHKNIGEFIEEIYAKELENYYEILSMHFERAGLDKKVSKYNYRSAVKAKNNFNFKDALYYYEKYLENFKICDKGYLEFEIIRVFMDIGYIYIDLTDYDKAVFYLHRALEVAILTDDIYTIKIMIATINKEKGMYKEALDILFEIESKLSLNNNIYGKMLQLKCSILRITGNSEVLHLIKEAEKALLQKKDYGNLSEAMNEAGILYFIRGDIDNAIHYLNKASEYAEKVNNLKVMVKVSGNLGIIYHASGLISKAIESINKAISISKKISNMLDHIMATNNLGILYLEMGVFYRAEALFKESFKESKKRSLPYHKCISLTNLADLMFERGDDKASLSLYIQSNQLAMKHSLPVEEGINYLGITKLHFKNNNYEEGLNTLEKSYQIFKETDEISCMSEYYRYMSIYQLNALELDKAMFYCEKSIESAIESRSDYKKLKGLRLKGTILAERGEYRETMEILSESITLSQHLESNYELAKGCYQKFTILYRQNLVEEACYFHLKAVEAIKETDENRWISIIEGALNEGEGNPLTFALNLMI